MARTTDLTGASTGGSNGDAIHSFHRFIHRPGYRPHPL